MPATLDKRADLAGPGIGDYAEIEKILPKDYKSLLTPKETRSEERRVGKECRL